MSQRQWLALLVMGILAAGAMAVFVRVPGYMDAEYYYATAAQLAEGRGFQEPFLWNYLDDALSLPHPSHLYWMPIASILAATGQKILGTGFRSAQVPFVILTAGLPALTAWVSLRIKATRRQAFLAGLLAAFPGFYLPFLVTTDAFAAYAWIGTMVFALGAAAHQTQRWFLWSAAGLAAGAAQLARADAVLLLVPILALALLSPRRRLMAVGLLAVGYAAVLGPWLARNVAVAGSLGASGGARTLWLTNYDELFTYPASRLEPARWLSQGLSSIVSARAKALGTNLTTLVVVVGSVVLGPFMLAGVWQRRREPMVASSAAYLGLLLTAMTVAFPFSGARGGLFHSAAGALPILWALAPIGVDSVLEWVSARRKWNPDRARRMFVPAIFVIVIGITTWVAWDRAAAGWPSASRWEVSDSQHRAVTEALLRLDDSPGPVAVNNPPGFYLASGLPCVVIPFGDVRTLRAVSERFHVEWLILDANVPAPLVGLYQDPESVPWLNLRGQVEDAQGRVVYLLQVTLPGASGTP